MTTETLDARPGDMAFTVRLNSPSAREAYRHLRNGRSQAKTVDHALTTVAEEKVGGDVEDAHAAFTYLRQEWATNKSETVREALRWAATLEATQ